MDELHIRRKIHYQYQLQSNRNKNHQIQQNYKKGYEATI